MQVAKEVSKKGILNMKGGEMREAELGVAARLSGEGKWGQGGGGCGGGPGEKFLRSRNVGYMRWNSLWRVREVEGGARVDKGAFTCQGVARCSANHSEGRCGGNPGMKGGVAKTKGAGLPSAAM